MADAKTLWWQSVYAVKTASKQAGSVQASPNFATAILGG